MGKWTLQIKPPFRGLAPGWYLNDNPTYGNQNMFGEMDSIDITDLSTFTQGPRPIKLTDGDETGAVDTLIKFIMEVPTSSDTTYAIGGNKLYQVSSTAVTNSSPWPYTIDKASVTGEDGECVVRLGNDLYYFYNHSGSAGDIGKESGGTFDDDWGSTTPTGASTLQDAPHKAVVAPNGIIYFTNGRYIGYYDPVTDTLSVDELDFNEDVVCVDIVFERNVLWIATNSPNTAGSNQNRGAIYVWDTVSESYQEPVIEVIGTIGGILTKNGTIFAFYQDLGNDSFKLGYVQGDTIQDIAGGVFTGTLPDFGQHTIYKNHIAWVSGQDVYMWGSADPSTPVALSKYSASQFSTGGGIAAPFGELLVASNASTDYELSRLDEYALGSVETLTYDVPRSMIDEVNVLYEPPDTGGGATLRISENFGANITEIGTIPESGDGDLVYKTFEPALNVSSFSLIVDYSTGSNVNPLKIRYIEIKGHTKQQNYGGSN